MNNIFLLGDSIIDNAPYVKKHEKDVESHLNSLFTCDSQIIINNRAVDGHTMNCLLYTSDAADE